jgi:hypothetical protein
VKEPKPEELTPVQKAWNKYKDTSDFMDPDDLMLLPIIKQANKQGENQRVHLHSDLKTV